MYAYDVDLILLHHVYMHQTAGTAATLGGSAGASTGAHVFTAGELPDVPVLAVDEGAPTTTLQVKAVNGKKIKIRYVIALSCVLYFLVEGFFVLGIACGWTNAPMHCV